MTAFDVVSVAPIARSLPNVLCSISGVQEKLGIINKGVVYAVFDYSAQNLDELTFSDSNSLVVLRKGDELEKDWWWARHGDREGYIPRNLLGVSALHYTTLHYTT